MAYVKNNPFIDGISGTVGNKINFRVRKNKTVVAVKRGPGSTPPTEEQQEVREQFAIASFYAKSAINDPAMKLLYQKAAKGGQTAHNAAFSDAMTPPVIDDVITSAYKGAAGNLITILARDVVTPKSAAVVILSRAGAVLEEGDAVLDATDRRKWIYTATAVNATLAGSRVVTTVTDLPGNTTKRETVIS